MTSLRAYAAVTGAYWAFMLTDGALRMLVLLHFHELGFTPVQLASLFVFYEVAGIVTNLTAGWLAARFGLALTLHLGLALQIAALVALTRLDPAWAVGTSVLFVMLVQGASGVAKDLTKTTSKSAVKLLAPEGGLYRWVAALTGSKNAVKGLGFFVGGGLLAVAGFVPALWIMAGGLLVVLVAVLATLPRDMSARDPGAKFTQMASPDARINWLSLARMFLFGARDVWFVVALPIWLHSTLEAQTGLTARDAFFAVGAFMALWVIGYGAVQAGTPRLIRHGSVPRAAGAALVLSALPLAMAAYLWSGGAAAWPVLAGLLAFGAVFAVNSALHSFLILDFAAAKRVARDVGFYYMANATGRLVGTLLSGLCYQAGGLALALAVSGGMVLLSAASLAPISRPRHLRPS